jgi:two-component system, cell cycle sensor histidine kinase and response regulator CckA
MRAMQFERGLLEIAHVSLEKASLSEALTTVARITATTLHVTRVSVWQLDHDGGRWRCTCAVDVATNEVTSGWELEASKYPSYGRAIAQNRTIAVADTRRDPASRELVEDYFDPLNIGATLDVPIYRSGRVFGIVCAEIVDGVRDWTQRERDFVTAVAELIASIFEQSARIEAESRLARAEATRRESEKMEALGRMAAAVAHDFNNILGVIQLLTDTLARQENDPVARAKTVALMRESSDAGRRLTRRLIACARADAITVSRQSLYEMVTALQSTLEGMVAPSELRVERREGDDTVLADRVGVEQVLLNLASNARDAIGQRRGSISVSVRRVGASVVLSVEDDGEGMDEATRKRMFEPFFSTRSKKSNAGLGMATVFRIVEAHHAVIDVQSTLGRGTRVDVVFPSTDSADDEA